MTSGGRKVDVGGCGREVDVQSARLERSVAKSRLPDDLQSFVGQFLNLFVVGLHPPDVMDNARPSPFFATLPHLCIIANANRRTG